MITMNHEGYLATIILDEELGVLSGHTVNTRATLHFEGETVAELKKEFAETVRDYREWCKERGVEPEKPYSGTLSLRINPDLHRRLAEEAAKHNESLNQFIAEQLERVA